MERQELEILIASAMSSKQRRVIFPGELITYPTDHIHKVRQERCNLGVCLQVLEGNLKGNATTLEPRSGSVCCHVKCSCPDSESPLVLASRNRDTDKNSTVCLLGVTQEAGSGPV